MLRLALSLLSSLQIGARLKQSFERSLRLAAVVAVAIIILLAAAGFGLLAAYQALISLYQFNSVEAAGIIAAALAMLGVLVLASVELLGRKPRRAPPTVLTTTEGNMGLVDQGLGKAMQQVGPVTLLVIAFLAGVLASRK
ncbi:MAG: hypothetical protein WBW08_11505 [Methyloceanibacter sp.]|jgi:hypothetical protein